MRSESVRKGIERAPHRSLLYALGLSLEEMNRPFIGVVNSFNEIVPGHKHLAALAGAVKKGQPRQLCGQTLGQGLNPADHHDCQRHDIK